MRLRHLAGGRLFVAIILLICFCFLLPSAEATGHIVWQKHLGGSQSDIAYGITHSNRGVVAVGHANALTANDDDVAGNRGYLDYWIVNLSSSGDLGWTKCLGGLWDETAYSILPVFDGNYIIAGSACSQDGDVSGIHQDEDCRDDKWCDSCPSDFWVAMISSYDGGVAWQKCLGGSSWDVAYSIQRAAGGFIVAGFAGSNDGDVSGNHGQSDCWIVKLDIYGDLIWQKCLGGSDRDGAYSIQQTADGGYIFAGNTFSNDGNVSGNHGQSDYWVVKLDEFGDLVWQRCLGGSGQDEAYSIQQTADGGYIVAGNTWSNDGNVSGNHGQSDYWIVKLDEFGDLVWQRCLGGSSEDEAYSIQQTSDGWYIVAGGTYSNDGDVSANRGNWDWWIVRLDPFGNIAWQRCLGGSSYEKAYSIQQTADDEYIIAGYTHSSNSYDVEGKNHGDEDFWIVKLSAIDCAITAPDTVCAGSTGNVASTKESGAEYHWFIDNGTITSASDTQSITFTAREYGPVSLSVYVHKNGYWDNCYVDIPVVSANCNWTSSSPVCNGTPVWLNGSAGMDSYIWDYGDGSPEGSGQTTEHTYPAIGSYTVRLNATLANCSKICTGTVVVEGPECSWTSNAPVCNNTPVLFYGPAGMVSYWWEFGDGNTSSEKNASNTYPASGLYDVNLTTTRCGINKSCNGTVLILELNCSWTSNSPVCNGTPVDFTGPAGMESYQWEFGDGQFSNNQSPSHLYSAAGTYAVNLTTVACGDSMTCNGTVLVNPMPECGWTSNSPVCNGTAVQFTGPDGMDSYYWDFGDGQNNTVKDPSHLYFAAGNYTVNLTTTGGSCSKSCIGTVVVEGPECDWTSNAPVCNKTPVLFYGPPEMDSYWWEFGDGNTSSEKNASNIYPASGLYDVNLTTTKCGINKICNGTVEVMAKENCSWSSSSPVCNGTPVQFIGPAWMESYQWEFGDGQFSNNQSPSHLYSAAGTYRVNLTTVACGSQGTCSGTVLVNPIPDCNWTSNAPVCSGTPVQFTGPEEMDSYYWDFGDGQFSNNQSPSHLYSAPGSYNVSLNVSKGNCSNECEGSVTIKPLPDCRWTSNSPVCNGTPIQFTGPAGMDDYKWEFGDNQTSNASSPSHLYSHLGTYIVVLTVTKDGCTKVCPGRVAVTAPDCQWTSSSPVCNGTPVQFNGTSGMDSYYWDFGDNATSNAEDPSHLYRLPGHYSVSLNVSKAGCTKTCKGPVIVEKLPDCNWTSNSPVCNGTPVNFTGPDDMDSYYWDFGDGRHSSSQNTSHLYSDLGTYTVGLNVTKGICSKRCTNTVVVMELSCSWTSNAPVCNGTPVNFTGPAWMDFYQWEFGDGHFSNNQSLSHLYSAAGTYRVNLTTVACNGSKTCNGTVLVKPMLECDWTSNSPVCNGTPVDFTGPAGMDSYYWDFGDGRYDLSQNASHLYSAAGTYRVNLTTVACGGSKTCSGTVLVKPMPDCSWTSSSPACNGTPVNFTASAGMDLYNWSFGDGAVSSAPAPSHLYSAPGTYAVSLNVTKDGCSRTCAGSVIVKPIPDCRWSSNSPVCDGTAVQFTGPAGMDSYSWEFGDGRESNNQSPSHLYSTPGSYNVSLNATKDGCSKVCEGSVAVKPVPDCRWSSSSPVCDGTAVQFTGPAEMDAYLWEFGDGQFSNNQSPSHLYSAPGSYNVNLNATKGSCSKNCTGLVVVNPMPECGWTSNSPVCNGTAVQFTGPAGMDSYSWELGDGAVSSAQNPSHLYSAPGTYAVNLTVTKNSCSTTCRGSVTVKPVPGCSWTSNSPVCNGTAVQFTGPAEMDSYRWEFADGAVSSAQNPFHLYSAPGGYNVNLTTTKGGCSKNCTGLVVVNPMPDCSWTSSSPVCNGTAVQFTGPVGVDSYSWELGDGAVSSAPAPSHLYSAPGTYAVNLTVTKNSCSTTCKGSVAVKPGPDCRWTSNSPVCNGTPVNFIGPEQIDSYSWSFGDGAASSAPSPSHIYSAPGTYTVSLNVAKDGCTKTCTGPVTVKPVPDCRWSCSSPVYDGVPVQFKGPSAMDSYQWEFGDGSKSTAENPSHVYPSSGTYTAELTVTLDGCSNSSSGSVLVRPSTKPPVQFGQFCEAQSIAGTGIVDRSTSIRDKTISLEYSSTMAGEGDIVLNSEQAYSQNADKIKRNLSSVNDSNESNLNLYGATKLTYSGAEPLVGGEYLHSKAFYGGMGASVQEVFAASEIEREQTAFFAQTLPFRPLNNSAETLPGELERAGRDTAWVDQLMRSREGIYNPSQLVGIEARAAFNGTWGTDARWHMMFYKDIASHEMFTGKFEAEKLLKFHRYPVSERAQSPCDGIDC